MNRTLTVVASGWVRCAPLAIWLGGFATLPGCGPGGPIPNRLGPSVHRPNPGVVLFLCDGLHSGLVEQGCQEGWLPNIRRRLVEGGTTVRNAISCVPAITYSSITTLLTGVAPPQHEVLGNDWFDRYERLYRDYHFIKTYRMVDRDFDEPTIYELIRPAESVSIQCAIARGATANFSNWLISGTMWGLGDFTAVDKLTGSTVNSVACWANWHGRWPAILTCYFPGVDTVGHRRGVESDAYKTAVRNFDHQLGRVCNWLERERLLDTTYIVMVSDHGLVSVDGFVDLADEVRRCLGRTATCTAPQDESRAVRSRHVDRFDSVIVNRGVRFASLHLAGAAGWDRVPDYAEVRAVMESAPQGAALCEAPWLDALAYRLSDTEVRLCSPRGSARLIESQAPGGVLTKYQPDSGDPLKYMTNDALRAFVEEGAHSARDWLLATATDEYPIAVPEIAGLLKSQRAGQVVFFAAPGWSFSHEKSGHGGIQRDELRIPLMFAGPGIPPGSSIATSHSVNFAPTIRAALNGEITSAESLAERLIRE